MRTNNGIFQYCYVILWNIFEYSLGGKTNCETELSKVARVQLGNGRMRLRAAFEWELLLSDSMLGASIDNDSVI